MSTAASSLLDMVSADEQTTLAAGSLARRLLAEHGDLPVDRVSLRYLGEVHLSMPNAGAVRAWAARLGVQVSSFTDEAPYKVVYEHHSADAFVEGKRVHIGACRVLRDAEAEAWRAARDGGTA
ncbi:hypothetical protein [Streptomyces chumphonensis]|uniref:hypothetical protein n=1 Tax=Streptomyces chumphonensis TaxID=1214925 RepID=UPI003D7601C4